MKATIIIPNINGKGWLKDSIESVYAQTMQDFRLIVVDNGSTDESLEQARSYCSRPNFTLIENGANTGFSTRSTRASPWPTASTWSCSTTTPSPSRTGWSSWSAPPTATSGSSRCRA